MGTHTEMSTYTNLAAAHAEKSNTYFFFQDEIKRQVDNNVQIFHFIVRSMEAYRSDPAFRAEAGGQEPSRSGLY